MNKKILTIKLILLFLAVFSSVQGIIYRFYKLDWFGMAIGTAVTGAIFLVVYLKSARTLFKTADKLGDSGQKGIFTASLYLLMYVFAAFLLLDSRTTDSIVSPWEKVSEYFFPVYFALTAILLWKAARSDKFTLVLATIHYFLSFGVALAVYKIGYGFDPFVHEATMDIIAEKGEVFPKPLYYLGYYGLVVPLSKFTGLSLGILNKILVPLFAAFFLPAVFADAIGRWLERKQPVILTVIMSLILPFSFFIVSTPQNLAFLFLLLAVIIGLKTDNWFELILVYSLSLAAFLAQPIAGIPAVVFSLAVTCFHMDRKKFKNFFYSLLFFVSAVAVPAAFYFLEKGMGFANPFGNGVFGRVFGPPSLVWPEGQNFLLNAAYLHIFNAEVIIFSLIACGIIIFWKSRRSCPVLNLYLLISAGLLASYFLMKLLSYGYLISYERADYPQRILVCGLIILFPFIIISLQWLGLKLISANAVVRSVFLVFLAAMILSSLHFSYPRKDAFFNSHGFSVGSDDIEAAAWIENDSNGDYIVLANQQVSAAALSLFGFDKYFADGSIFYYPIPTGGMLYGRFLSMIQDKPERKTMLEAMDAAGVDTGYFVVNKYWWASKKIIEEAKLSSDSEHRINGGSIHIFKYVRE